MQPKSSRVSARPNAPAFTLIELLAVIAILALLAAMLLPAQAKTKLKSQALCCLNNNKQTTLAWLMYASDCAGAVPPNADGGVNGAAPIEAAWVAGWLDFTADNTANTNTDYLVNRAKYPYAACLGPYIKNPKSFKCPADTAQVIEGDQLMDRVRSVSMNSWLGGDPAPGVAGSRTWTNPSRYGGWYRRLPDVRDPALTIVVLDERADSINDGWWGTDPDIPYSIVDWPAGYHDGAGRLSFVDGHSSLHQWTDARTMPALKPGQIIAANQELPGDVDVLWMAQHAVGLPNYP